MRGQLANATSVKRPRLIRSVHTVRGMTVLAGLTSTGWSWHPAHADEATTRCDSAAAARRRPPQRPGCSDLAGSPSVCSRRRGGGGGANPPGGGGRAWLLGGVWREGGPRYREELPVAVINNPASTLATSETISQTVLERIPTQRLTKAVTSSATTSPKVPTHPTVPPRALNVNDHRRALVSQGPAHVASARAAGVPYPRNATEVALSRVPPYSTLGSPQLHRPDARGRSLSRGASGR